MVLILYLITMNDKYDPENFEPVYVEWETNLNFMFQKCKFSLEFDASN